MLEPAGTGGGATIINLAEHRARLAAHRGAAAPAPGGSPNTAAVPASALQRGDRILCHETGEVGEVIGLATNAGGLMALIEFPSRRRRAVPVSAIGASNHGAASAAATAQAAAQQQLALLPCDCEPQP